MQAAGVSARQTPQSPHELRTIGNEWYAKSKSGRLDDQRRCLHTAIEWYQKAINAAKSDEHDARASSHKNIGVCYAALEKIEPKRPVELYYLKEATRARAKALEHAEHSTEKTQQWRDQVKEDMQSCVDLYIERSEGLVEDTIEQILLCARGDIAHKGYNEMMCTHRHDQGERMLNKCMQLVGEREYKKALPALHDINFPIEEGKRHLKRLAPPAKPFNFLSMFRALFTERPTVADPNEPIWKELTKEIGVLEQEWMSFMSIAKGLQSYDNGETALKQAIEAEGLEKKSDLAYNAMDHFKTTEVVSRGEDVELVAMAQTKIGVALYKVFKFREKAKRCFNEAVKLSMTLYGQLHNRPWYTELTETMQALRDEEEELENQQWDNKRKPYLEELKTELEEIWAKKNDEPNDIVDFLWKKFPPKHKKDAKKPDGTVTGKKKLLKLNQIYHPDKVDEEKFGTKYKVLCEEITKMINYKYERLKELD